jgi:hypothetical protein
VTSSAIRSYFFTYITKARRKETTRKTEKWVDNVKMDLGEIEWDGTDWINLAQDRDQWKALGSTVMNRRFP